MAIEIELKARAGDPEERKRIISQFAGPAEEFFKEDSYWYPQTGPGAVPQREEHRGRRGLPSGVRVRREEHRGPPGGDLPGGEMPGGGEPSRTTRVCFKIKERREGIEINDEREFEVSDGEVFEDLLARLGLYPGVYKRKQGWAWTYRGVLIELCEVSGSVFPEKAGTPVRLGWFAELEILADRSGAETAARARLLETLEKTGINEDMIEERYYTELLRGPDCT
jgi:adenylate cyclase class 2